MKKLKKTSNKNNNKYDTISIVNEKYKFFDSFIHRNATGSISGGMGVFHERQAVKVPKKSFVSLFIYYFYQIQQY